MQYGNYKVNRDNVYVGKLGIASFINWYSDKIVLNNWQPLRNILFSMKYDMAEDLLYNTPMYPVLNYSDIEVEDGVDECLLIQDVYSLELLLEYYSYKKQLTIDDLLSVRNKFFSGTFVKDHCKDFGYREVMVDNMSFYYDGHLVTDLDEIKKKKEEFINKQKMGRRIFVLDEPNELSDYFNILDDFNDEKYIECGFPCMMRKDGFKPNIMEGPVRKLKKNTLF